MVPCLRLRRTACANRDISEAAGRYTLRMESLSQLPAIARRMARRNALFASVSVVTLAIATGFHIAVFAVFNSVLLRPLPYPDPDQLVWIHATTKSNTVSSVTPTPDYLAWRDQNSTFSHIGGFNPGSRVVTGLSTPQRLRAARISAGLLPTLGVEPSIGRNFLPEEDLRGGGNVVILTHKFWQSQFSGQAEAVGSSVTLDGRLFTVIGILPESFRFPGMPTVELFTPLAKDEAAERRGARSVVRGIVGRLRPEATLTEAKTELGFLQSQLVRSDLRGREFSTEIIPLREHLFGDARPVLLGLFGSVSLMLLVACANLSGLSLARVAAGRRDLVVRAALGANRRQLAGHVVSEHAVLVLAGSAFGIAAAVVSRRIVLNSPALRTLGVETIPFDWRVGLFSAAVTAVALVGFALLPALAGMRQNLGSALRSGDARLGMGLKQRRMLSGVVVAQLAMTLVLLTGTGVVTKGVWRMLNVNLGFQPDHLVGVDIALSRSRYRDRSDQLQFFERVRELSAAAPGVEAAALVSALPPGVDRYEGNSFAIEGWETDDPASRPFGRHVIADAAYLDVMKIPLLSGRWISSEDHEGALPTVVIGRTLAQRFFQDGDSIGRRVRLGSSEKPWRTVVGVVEDIKNLGLDVAAAPQLYVPYRQAERLSRASVVVRISDGQESLPAVLRSAVRSVDVNQPIDRIASMESRLASTLEQPRQVRTLLMVFGLLATTLAGIGIFSTLSAFAAARVHEFGVRSALGASPAAIRGMVFGAGVRLAVVGLLLGVVIVTGLGPVISSLFFDLNPVDPTILIGAVGVLLLITLASGCYPAIRAGRRNPLESLRSE